MILAVDTETTGLDLRHSCKPFYVTTCRDDGTQENWEWAVDPLTRQPIIPEKEIDRIRALVASADKLVLHNAKFDVTALSTIIPEYAEGWPWEKTEDTLVMAHLLGSNRPKNLTDLCITWLGVDIEPLEKGLEDAVKGARKLVQLARLRIKNAAKRDDPPQPDDEALALWRIAQEDDPEIPSCGGKEWRNDYWMPAAAALHMGDSAHPWATVLADYANEDSGATLALYNRLLEEIRKRKLGAIYRERLKVVAHTHEMEVRGVTLSSERLDAISGEYSVAAERSGKVMAGIARGLGYDLKLPKGASPNQSVKDFCFGPLGLEPMRSKKSKTDAPSASLPADSTYYAPASLRWHSAVTSRRCNGVVPPDVGASMDFGYAPPPRPSVNTLIAARPPITAFGTTHEYDAVSPAVTDIRLSSPSPLNTPDGVPRRTRRNGGSSTESRPRALFGRDYMNQHYTVSILPPDHRRHRRHHRGGYTGDGTGLPVPPTGSSGRGPWS